MEADIILLKLESFKISIFGDSIPILHLFNIRGSKNHQKDENFPFNLNVYSNQYHLENIFKTRE